MTAIDRISSLSHKQTQQFAFACLDNNSITELREALAGGPDATDMDTWGLTAEQWTKAIRLALDGKMESGE